MTKGSSGKTSSVRPPKNPFAGRYKVAGKLSDGVAILTPKSRPKSFTAKQIKSTIEELRRDSKIGRFAKVEAGRG
jgi:hypothetical protein